MYLYAKCIYMQTSSDKWEEIDVSMGFVFF